MPNLKCRHCLSPLDHSFLDLGHQPPSNSYLDHQRLGLPEITYPLKTYVCTECWLVQLPKHAEAHELFTDDYAYFSSTSTTWCAHAEKFVNQAITRLGLTANSLVTEIASNDGYLLQYLVDLGIPCVGIEPTSATAQAAIKRGIPTIIRFFGVSLAQELEKADLIIANNVLAHVPDINNFMQGLALLLKPDGMISVEFPHLLNLLYGNQFDTIYHEHYSYLSLDIVVRLCTEFGLEVIDVERLNTHGGSLRVWAAHSGRYVPTKSVKVVLNLETKLGLRNLKSYDSLQSKADETKYALLKLLIDAKSRNEIVYGYGAAAKGNTLLNFAGIRSDLLPFVIDRAHSKQGKYLPGSHIPIVGPDQLDNCNPDLLLVLPWNLVREIKHQLPRYRLATVIPEVIYW